MTGISRSVEVSYLRKFGASVVICARSDHSCHELYMAEIVLVVYLCCVRPDKTSSGVLGCAPHDVVGLPELMELAIVLTGTVARVAEERELTPMQGRLLCGLAERPQRMADLAQSLGIEKAALTGLVDRAERRGLVERLPVSGDRRAIQVTLTDDGGKAVVAFESGVASALDELLEALPVKDRTEFRRLASAVVGAVRTG
jgi:DNA-binding MarR family transcriptional regulator